MSNISRFSNKVADLMCFKCLLADDTEVQGVSYTTFISDLRANGYKMGSYEGNKELMAKMGYKMVRGRVERYYRGGKLGWGKECDVFVKI